MTGRRIEALDFLKCVCIGLMVVFHLAYVGDKYPAVKTFVYTFHMPAFLLVSGYLMKPCKAPRPFFRGLLWLFIPYAVMETGYVLMSAVLPVREPVVSLTTGLWLQKLFVNPLGPYWYLHTLMLCQLLAYGVYRLPGRWSEALRLGCLALLFGGVSLLFQKFSWADSLYFGAGLFLARIGVGFTTFFRPSLWACLPLAVLACFPVCHDRATPGGVAIVWLVVSALLDVYGRLPREGRVRAVCHFIGRNTLVILLFSPVFTMLAKFAVPWFAFDPTGLLYAVAATAFTLVGSLGGAWALDRLHLSRWFLGRQALS